MTTTSLNLITTAVLALAVSAGVQAQTSSNSTSTATATTANKLSHQDTSFLKDAAENNNAEVAASQLAVTQSTNADVKSFAQEMIEDHGKAGTELKSLAEQKGVKVSDTPSSMKKLELKMLSERKGASFDQHYADSIGVQSHKDTIKLFQKEADKGTDPDVKAWAAKTLPELQHHLERAQALKTKADTENKRS